MLFAIISTSANISGAATPATYKMIDDAIISNIDYVVKYRRDDDSIVAPSRLVRINEEGSLEMLRG